MSNGVRLWLSASGEARESVCVAGVLAALARAFQARGGVGKERREGGARAGEGAEGEGGVMGHEGARMATLSEVLGKIHAPKGMTSLIAGVMSGDFDSIRSQDATGLSLVTARAKLEAAQKAQNECKREAAYWGYAGDLAYWRAVVDILTAAELVGLDNLADIPKPEGAVVMDMCAATERYGREVLRRAKATVAVSD